MHQQHAQRQLKGGEGNKVGGSEQPQVRGVHSQVVGQIGRQHRVYDAIKIGKKVAQRERQKNLNAFGDGNLHFAFPGIRKPPDGLARPGPLKASREKTAAINTRYGESARRQGLIARYGPEVNHINLLAKFCHP